MSYKNRKVEYDRCLTLGLKVSEPLAEEFAPKIVPKAEVKKNVK